MDIINVDVTLEDIDSGEPMRSACCPIALAIKRQLRCEDVDVQLRSAEIDGALYFLPVEARTFIDRFDAGDNVRPLSFGMQRVRSAVAAPRREAARTDPFGCEVVIWESAS